MNIKTGFAALAMVASLGVAGQASAAGLLTDGSGYTGPTIDIGIYANQYFTFTEGPLSLPGGVTYSAGNPSSVLGNGNYGLNDNGNSLNANIIGTNTGNTFVTLVFDTAVGMFGGGFNYAAFDSIGTPGYDPVIIRAFDESDNLIASYDLGALAPIATPGGLDVFRFRGIDGQGQLIKKFEFGGSYAILQVNGGGVVPEPGTWALMILGFGAAGAMLRSRRRVAATG